MATGTVTIIGAGYVGLTTAVLFACSGTKTYLVDIEPEKIAKIRGGESPFFEPHLNSFIQKALKTGRLVPTTRYAYAIPGSKLVFCCVGTPDKADGSSNLEYVYDALLTAAKLATDGVIMIQKSTVPVGTGKDVSTAIKKTNPNLKFDYVSNPEFLREGSAIKDSLFPDRTVLGGKNKQALLDVAAVYKKLYKVAPKLLPAAKANNVAEDFIYTTLESAELIKVTANAFLALKISFANSIAKLCDSVGADINEVMDGVGKDNRIGKAFLNAGRGYGGGCFPKDVSGLLASAAEHNTELEIMAAAVHVNNSMAHFIIDKIEDRHQPVQGKKVAVLGLSFKAGTSDTRRSPAIKLANLLVEKGAKVSAYDPEAIIEDNGLRESIVRYESIEDSLKGADMALLATDWQEFLELDWGKVKKLMSGHLIVDCMNTLDEKNVIAAGLNYMGVGRF